MGSLTFRVPGVPVPWARARQRGRAHFTRPKVAAAKKAIAAKAYYTDPKVAKAKQAVALAAKAAGASPFEGPIGVSVTFDYEREETFVVVMDGLGGKDTRPDLDNLIKLVLDALNGVAWHDDGQVCVISARKVAKTRKPRKKRP